MDPETVAERVAMPTLVDWRAITAGAVVAAGISFTLMAFGAGIGLSIVSTSPTWRDSSGWLWMLSGLFLIFVALCSFGFGGYVTGRLQVRGRATVREEWEFGDGMHGVAMWALAILLTAVLTLGGAAVAVHETSPSTGPAASTSGETLLASELDELFRTDRAGLPPNIEYRRAEAARILLKSSNQHGVPDADRAYLAAIVAAGTGLSNPDAVARVDQIIGEAADALHRVRTASVMQTFMLAASLVVGLAVAWFSAVEGGRERELGLLPTWTPLTFGRRRGLPG